MNSDALKDISMIDDAIWSWICKVHLRRTTCIWWRDTATELQFQNWKPHTSKVWGIWQYMYPNQSNKRITRPKHQLCYQQHQHRRFYLLHLLRPKGFTRSSEFPTEKLKKEHQWVALMNKFSHLTRPIQNQSMEPKCPQVPYNMFYPTLWYSGHV